MKKSLLFIFLVMVLFSGCTYYDTIVEFPFDEEGNMEVSIQDYTGEIQDYFYINVLQSTTLINNVIKNSNKINITNPTGCLVGDAVNIYDDKSYFQGIITNTVGNEITFTPRIDKEFSLSNTIIKCGEWNMAVDGSVSPVNYCVNPPTNVSWHVISGVFYILDNSAMDDGLFGSRTSLSNGLSLSVNDGYMKNLFLIYNNAGFNLRKYDKEYTDKAPSGQYGMIASINYKEKYGAIIELNGNTNDTFCYTISDNLLSQNEIASTIGAHTTNNYEKWMTE